MQKIVVGLTALSCVRACKRVCVFDSNRIDNLIVIHIQASQSIVNVPCEFNSQYKHILATLRPPGVSSNFNKIAYICYLEILYKSFHDWYIHILLEPFQSRCTFVLLISIVYSSCVTSHMQQICMVSISLFHRLLVSFWAVVYAEIWGQNVLFGKIHFIQV